ncbi:MAG: hypothetical protein JNK57_12915 [Planctomycetaceae bacterium]|nr:hypothetical protein [Planctomycetaceae bacterium]
MKKTHENREPSWEMDTQWALKFICGKGNSGGIQPEGSGGGDWLCESHLSMLDDEIAVDLSRLEQKYASFVTTNSRRSRASESRRTSE